MNKRKIFKRTYRGLIALLLLLFLLLVSLYFLIQSPSFQNYVSKKVTHTISEKLGIEVSIGNIEVAFFNNILLENFFIADHNQDTLLYFDKANANFSYVSLLGKNINLDNLDIDGLNILIHRSKNDTAFNFNFLLPKKKEKKSISDKEVWDIVLNKINLKNTQFKYQDSLSGTIIHSKLPNLNIQMKTFNLDEKKFEINSLKIINPDIQFAKTKNNNKNQKKFVLNIPAFIYAREIEIEKANFNFKNYLDTLSYYNLAFNNLEIKEIDINISNTYLWNDSLSTTINQLALQEQSGFRIKNLNTQISLNNQTILLDTLSLKTNSSTINANGKMRFKNFEDFKQFDRKVRFNVNLSNTVINPDDLKYFVDTKNLGIGGVFKLNGEIKGKLSSLRAKNIELFAGNRTRFEGNFSLNGLPKIKETFISFKMKNLVTDYDDLKFIHNKIPLPINARKLGTIVFKGRFDGFYTDFVTYGEAETALGFVNTDINFKIADNGTPSYSGKFNVDKFEVGKWFGNDDMLGNVTLNGVIKGKGVKLKTLDAKLKAKVEELTVKGYTYRNLHIDGSLKEKFFQGNFVIDDTHLKMNFEGLVDATGKVPIFDFTAQLKKIELLPLNLSKKNYVLSGELKSNFTANNIDNIIGDLEVNKITIRLEDKTYHLNNLVINSSQHDGEKHFELFADNIKVLAHGNYQFKTLPKAVKQILFANDTLNISPQNLRFDAEITDNTELISLFIPKLKIPKKILISGNLNSETNSMLASVNIPKLAFGNLKTNNFISNIYVSNGEIDMISSLPKIVLNDSVFLKDISILAKGTNDDINFGINISNKNEKTSLALKGNVKYEKRLFTVSLDDNSTILINNSFWNIEKGNAISFNKNVLIANNFSLKNNNSEANFKVNKRNGTNNLILNLKDIEVADFTEILRDKGLDLKGQITGEVKIDNFDKEPAINGNLDFLGILLNNYKIGDFKLNSRVDLPDKMVYLSGGLYSKENHIDINGAYSFSKNSTEKDVDLNIYIKQFTVKSFEDFIPRFISNSSGTLNGNLTLQGPIKKLNLTGFVDVNDVTTTVSYTKVKYTIAGTRVLFKNNILQLEDGFLLQDDEGNKGYGSGSVTHENFKNWALNLKVVTNKLKALNTTIKDNEIFNGLAYLKGGATFTGLTTEPLIYIWGESEGKSKLDIPLMDNVNIKQHEFYSFVQKDKDKEETTKKDDESVKIRGAKVQLDLNIDEDLELKLILDQDAGDVLKVKGKGDIKIDVGQAAEYVDFFGDFVVSNGDYLFTMQNIINKPFKIEPGSVIKFNGDIYEDATIDMEATYTRKVALDNFITEYLSDTDEELKSIARSRVPVSLYLDLKEKLSKPTITFDIGIERIDPKIRNYVDSKLQAIKLNDSEMNNQIFGVLVLSRFLPSYTALESSASSNIGDAAINTVSEFISSQFSRYLTDWASYLVKDLELFVNFTTYEQSAFTSQKRRELQLALTKRFFDDRLSINVGGNLDFGDNNGNDQTSNATFFGANVSFEYTITKNRRWRIKAFTDSDYDNYNTENNRKTKSGIGLSYKREFDDIYDLFNIKKKKK